MIKLALSDLDNTLVPFGSPTASERSLAAIHGCLDAGVLFGVATGRNRLEALRFLRGDRAGMATGVFCNGQQVVYRGEVIREVTLPAADLRRAAEVVCSHAHCALITYRPDGHADWVGDDRDTLGPFPAAAMLDGDTRHTALPEYPVVKAGIIACTDEREERQLRDELVEACPGLGFVRTVAQWMDVIARGWDKARGVGVLCEAAGLRPDEVCVFGDAENDLAMFGCVSHSCAVANATPAASAVARWHIGASADDGVAQALEQIACAARHQAVPAFMRP